MMTTAQDKGIGNHILKYGPVYLFAGSLIVNWALTTAKIEQLDYRVTKVEAVQETSSEILSTMKIDIAVIKDNVAEIKKRVQ